MRHSATAVARPGAPIVRVMVSLALAATAALLFAPSLAHASKGTVEIWGSSGSGAGQLFTPTQIAVNDSSGDVYVVDSNNNRISVFDSSGAFLRAWGWGVVASGPDNDPQNEQQKIEVDATGGTFRLGGPRGITEATPPIPFDATAAQVQSELEGLKDFEPGDIAVSGAAGGPWTVDFIGARADEDVIQIKGWDHEPIQNCEEEDPCDQGNPTLTGGAANLTVSTVVDGANFEICEAAAGDTCRRGQSRSGHAGELSGATGIAIDQTSGDVFVGDQGHKRVQRFDAAGNFLRTWGKDVDVGGGEGFEVCTVAANCKQGKSGSGNGEILLEDSRAGAGGNLAVDPGSGNVFLADLGNHRVQQFTPNGGFVGTFGRVAEYSRLSEGIPGFCTENEDDHLFRAAEPVGIAIGSEGTVFTGHQAGVSNGGSNLILPQPGGGCETEEKVPFSLKSYTQAGGFLGTVAPAELTGHSPIWAAADPTDGHLYVAFLDGAGGNEDVPPLSWQLGELDASGQLVDLHATGIPEPSGIAVDPGSGRLYVTTEGGGESRIFVLDEVANPPTATIAAASAVTSAGATLHGSLNPGGEPFPGASTGYHFEYRAVGGQAWTSAPFPDLDAGAGTESVAVNSPVSGLDPATTYEARLVASRKLGAGKAFSATTEFTTGAVPPATAPRSAFPVTDTEATLRALVNAKHSPSTYYFQYGPADCSANPCTSVPAGEDGDAGSAVGPKPVQAKVSGLVPETTYHFRVLAENQAGAVEGEDGTFTTTSAAAAAWPARGIELVSPPEKGNQPPIVGGFSFADRVSPVFDNDHIVWETRSGIPGSPQGSNDVILSSRSVDGWHSHSLVPSIAEQEEQVDDATRTYAPIGATPNFDSTLLLADTFGGTVPFPKVVVRSGTTGGFSKLFSYQPFSFRAVYPSRDLTRVFVEATREDLGAAADPNHLAGTTNLYDVGGEAPTLVDRMPDGSVPSCGLQGGNGLDQGFARTGYPWSSADGSRLFFESRVSKCNGPIRIFVRDLDAGTTTTVSSPALGDSRFIRADGSGTAAIFISTGALVKADTNADPDIYRWDAASGVSCLTCVVKDAKVTTGSTRGREVIVSPDLSHSYFVSTSQLVPGHGIPGKPAIYVWHDGTIDFVAPYGDTAGDEDMFTSLADEINGARTSSDGTVLLFASSATDTTADETGVARLQIYRYKEGEGVECVTCLSPGTPHGQSSHGIDDMPYNGMTSVAMSADGRTVVFASYVPYVARDINGSVDIYEWRDGRIRLLTDGATELPDSVQVSPRVVGMTPDGADVFFLSSLRLTGRETDRNMQLFDARVGGGVPPPPAAPAPCVEDACQGPLQAPPSAAAAASAAFAGPGNEGRARHKQRAKRHHRPRHPKCRSTKHVAKHGRKCVGKGRKRGNANGGRQAR